MILAIALAKGNLILPSLAGILDENSYIEWWCPPQKNNNSDKNVNSFNLQN